MTFKDQVSADLAIFLNTEEFGEMHTIVLEGATYEIPIVVSKDMSLAFSKGWDGTYLSEMQISFRLTDVARKPIKGQSLILDGKRFLVREANNEMGLVVVILEVLEG